jgi:hypothetical protein
MMTLISTALSFLMGGVPKILDIFQDHSDKKQELALAQLQIEREMKMMEAGYASQARVAEIQTEQIAMQTQSANLQAAYAHDIETAKGASTWVINCRAMVRPAITYGMFLLLVFVDVFGFYYAIHTGVAFDDALNQLWDDDSQQIFASIIAFYFGGQAFKK